jgi:CheY-like chemotaxis protein
MSGPVVECRQQIADAEREMGAFVAAVGRRSGPAAAVRAAEHWIELAESTSLPLVDGRPNWRTLTIMAASRLATDHRLNGQVAQGEAKGQVTDIVVVDDNQMLLRVISEIFKERGYPVRTATNGFGALAQIRRKVPHVLVSDLNMPGMSGFELLSVVRRRFPEIVTIAMSGAYLGTDVVPPIAADAFYAKGSTNFAQLFEIVRTIANSPDLYAARSTTPIWIQGLPIDRSDTATGFVSCPECLRAFPHPLPPANIFQGMKCCPHCLEPVQLAIVRQSREPDNTLFPISDVAQQGSESAARARQFADEPVERWTRQ